MNCKALDCILRALSKIDKTAVKVEDLAKYVNYLRRKHNILVIEVALLYAWSSYRYYKLRDKIDILESNSKGE